MILLDRIGFWAFLLYVVSVVVSIYVYIVLQAAGVPASPFAEKYSGQVMDPRKVREAVGNVSGNVVVQVSEGAGGVYAHSLEGAAAVISFMTRVFAGIPALLADMVAVMNGHPLYPQILGIATAVGWFLQVAAYYYMLSRLGSAIASLFGRG